MNLKEKTQLTGMTYERKRLSDYFELKKKGQTKNSVVYFCSFAINTSEICFIGNFDITFNCIQMRAPSRGVNNNTSLRASTSVFIFRCYTSLS